MTLTATASQTVGPYFSIGMTWPEGGELTTASEGVIEIDGQVFDADGAVVDDAVLEIWQADPEGRYAHPEDRRNSAVDSNFRGFGRVGTGSGGFRFRTLKPGRVAALDGRLQAPHILVSVFARGLLCRLATRLYFAEEAANEEDPVLALVPEDRRATLLAQSQGEGRYRWDVHLQGPRETVFFAF